MFRPEHFQCNELVIFELSIICESEKLLIFQEYMFV